MIRTIREVSRARMARLFKLQLDSSSSADHPNVPDAEPHPDFLGGPDRVESTGCLDLDGYVRCDTRQQQTPILGNFETFVIHGILGMVARSGCTQR
jgi:hypothetical protein